jgi:hypothetical protein
MKRDKHTGGKTGEGSTFFGPFGQCKGFHPQKRWPWLDLRKEKKKVMERKVVVMNRQGEGVNGEPVERLGGARGTKGDSPASKTMPRGDNKEEIKVRRGHEEGAVNGLITG